MTDTNTDGANFSQGGATQFVGAPGTPLIPMQQPPAPADTRPGGPPARTLIDDKLERLEQTLAQLTAAQQSTVQEAMGAKETKRDAETRLTEIETQLANSQRELALARVAQQAGAAGARNAHTVAKLIAGENDPVRALEALKVSDPYLFGPEPRPAGTDMTQGQSGGSGLDALDRHIREKYGAPAVPS